LVDNEALGVSDLKSINYHHEQAGSIKFEAAGQLTRFWKSIEPYIVIARPDHWFKNVFVLPGVVFAIYDSPSQFSWTLLSSLVLGFAATCLVASSNYVINEILDGPQDRQHPVKKNRPVPSGEVRVGIGYLEWLILAISGLATAARVNIWFLAVLFLLWVMGLIYNVPLIRLKDLPYLDVLTESINNPIRLCLGWFIVIQSYPPTLSLLMAYWMIGAFFMATKRLAEYKRINDPETAAKYRKSFSYYNTYRLILSIVYYSSAFSLFFGIFLVRYRIELILSVPFLAGFIPIYMRMGFWQDSPAQYPEKLYRQRGLTLYTAFCVLLVLTLLFLDIPIIAKIFEPVSTPGN
jgi:4-hydroxybenzoate polyprenyltransferase